jgi:hypothetical protein
MSLRRSNGEKKRGILRYLRYFGRERGIYGILGERKTLEKKQHKNRRGAIVEINSVGLRCLVGLLGGKSAKDS